MSLQLIFNLYYHRGSFHTYVPGRECLLFLAFVPVERKAVIENDTDFQQTSDDFEQHMRDLKVQFGLKVPTTREIQGQSGTLPFGRVLPELYAKGSTQ